MFSNKTSIKNNTLTKDSYQSDVYLYFSRWLKKNMQDFFADIKEISGKENQDNQQLLSVEIHKLNILISYLRTIKNIFMQFEKGHYDFFDEKSIKLSSNKQAFNAIEKDEINEKQLQNCLIHKYEKKNLAVLFQFKQQLSLLYNQSVDSTKLTLSPFVVVSTFAKSIRLLQLSYKNKLILYKSFEKCLLNQLNTVYEEILSHYFKQESTTHDKNQKTLATAIDIKNQNHSLEQIVQAIGIVQNSVSLKDPLKIKNAFLSQLQKNNNQSLTQIDKDNLNLITLLFQKIQNNKLIEQPIKETLSRLQLSYIMYAFFDEALLQNHQHPAKLLLNEISNASEKWSKHKDKKAKYLKELKRFINTIITEDAASIEFFNQKIQVFKAIVADYQEFFAPLEPQNNSDEGRNKIITAMKTIDALLDHKSEEYNTPEYLNKILRTPWKNLLVLLLVRHSNSSNEYLEMINFIDDLFALLTPNKPQIALEQSISKVCATFEKGLKLIAYRDDDIREQSKELKKFILNYHKNHTKKKNTSLRDDIITKIHSSISLFNKSNKPKVEKKVVNINKFLMELNNADKQLVRPISYGTWLKFKHSNGKIIEAQLSWINPKTGRYLFVNNKGLKITDKSAKQLADGIRDNDIVIK